MYGDALESPDLNQAHALGRSDVSSQQLYLRCVVLLVRLTGRYVARFLPQVRSPRQSCMFMFPFSVASPMEQRIRMPDV